MIVPNEQFWKVFKETNGALSTAEALAIMNVAALAPEGIYIELGTHMGKSAMAAYVTLKERGVFYLVDPIFADPKISNRVESDVYETISGKITTVALNDTSLSVLDYSADNYAYVFVDSGSHGDGLPMAEAKSLEDRMVQGGILAFHDFRNQFVEVEGAYNYLLGTGKYEEVPINWNEIFEYVKEHDLENGNTSWHQYPELSHPPNFVGALRRK